VNSLQRELVTDRQETRDALTVDFLSKRFYNADDIRDYSLGELKYVGF
jgi:hypothetical protein